MQRILGSERGFTLIEVLLVVSIISIIAGMALPSVGGTIVEGRSTGKAGDLRQMTIAITRSFEDTRSFPAVGGSLPPVTVRDVDGDGIVRVSIDSNTGDLGAGDAAGSLPSNIDATCASASTDLADAVAQCFVGVDVASVIDFLDGRLEHVGEDITLDDGTTPSFDDDQATPDWQGGSVNLAGLGLWIYVVDDGGPSGTAFPSGTVSVWNITKDGKPWVLKSDTSFGR